MCFYINFSLCLKTVGLPVTDPSGVRCGQEERHEAEDGQQEGGSAEEEHQAVRQSRPHVLPDHQHVQTLQTESCWLHF